MQQNYAYEDEIDLRELIKTIWNYKNFITIFVVLVTILSVVVVLIMPKVYEATATLEIGSYKEKDKNILLDNANKLSQLLNVLYIDLFKNQQDKVSWIEKVEVIKNQDSFIRIISQAYSNKDAIDDLNKTMQFVILSHQKIIQEMIEKREFALQEVQRQISALENGTLVGIDEKISFTQKTKLPFIKEKIDQTNQKIQSTQKQLKLITSNIKQTANKNPSLTALNIIEKGNLESEISALKLTQINLENEKEELVLVAIPSLLREKDKITNMDLKKLVEEKRIVENSMLSHNFKNTKIVGKIITNDYPIKPKKKLIVMVSFFTSFVMALFLVFFFEFIKSFKNEEKIKSLS